MSLRITDGYVAGSRVKLIAGSRAFWAAFGVALLLAIIACAPAASGPAASGQAVGVEGIEAGNTSPPFAMTLEDGSEVALKDIVDGDKAVHLFWFATW